MKSLIVVAGCVCGIAMFSGNAQEEKKADKADEEKDWLEFYYQDPKPERFVDEVKNFSKDGVLSNDGARPALIAFFSQVMRQNKEKLPEWYEALAGLPDADRQTLHTGMLFSRTKAADELMTKKFGQKYLDQKADTPKILEMPLDKAETLDMLWGFYYATGSESAIRRMILAFRFVDAPDELKGVDIPKGYSPLFKELPIHYADSLVSNAERHPKVIETLEKLYKEDKSFAPIEKQWLYDVLSTINPKKYPERKDPSTEV